MMPTMISLFGNGQLVLRPERNRGPFDYPDGHPPATPKPGNDGRAPARFTARSQDITRVARGPAAVITSPPPAPSCAPPASPKAAVRTGSWAERLFEAPIVATFPGEMRPTDDHEKCLFDAKEPTDEVTIPDWQPKEEPEEELEEEGWDVEIEVCEEEEEATAEVSCGPEGGH